MKLAALSAVPLAIGACLLVTAAARRADAVGVASTVYVVTTGNVEALEGVTLSQALPPFPANDAHRSIALAPDGSFGCVSGEEGAIQKFDPATNAAGTGAVLFNDDTLEDVVISPDGTRIYATLVYAGAVGVIGASDLSEVTEYPLPVVSSNTPYPSAIDMSPDGTALFVLNTRDFVVVKLAAADGTVLDSASVSPSAVELKVSLDGTAIVVVGGDGAQFLSASTLDPIPGADSTFYGGFVDVAVAGTRAYALNSSYTSPPVKRERPRGGPKAFNSPVVGEPAIDVYDAATGAHQETFPCGPGGAVLGIAVHEDSATAFFSRAAYGGGTVTAMDLGTSNLGASHQTGPDPRRLAIGTGAAGPETPVVSYCLPRSVTVKIAGAGKDSLGASGFYDVGDKTVDYTQPVTIDIGGFTKTFTLVAKGASFVSPADPVVKFAIVPNLKGSSRGKFRMKLAKTTLAGLVDPAATLAFHFRGAGLPDAAGSVRLTAGGYKLGKARGALVSPAFFPQKATAKVGAANADTLSFKGGFATNGQTPAALGAVRFSFGSAFTRTVQGAEFTKSGDVFKFSAKQGATSFSITIDFLRETVTVSGKKVELGDLAGPTTDVVFDAGAGAGPIRNTIVLGAAGTKRGY